MWAPGYGQQHSRTPPTHTHTVSYCMHTVHDPYLSVCGWTPACDLEARTSGLGGLARAPSNSCHAPNRWRCETGWLLQTTRPDNQCSGENSNIYRNVMVPLGQSSDLCLLSSCRKPTTPTSQIHLHQAVRTLTLNWLSRGWFYF